MSSTNIQPKKDLLLDDIQHIENEIALNRRPERFTPEHRRVITRFFLPGGPDRIRNVIERVIECDEEIVHQKLDEIFRDFNHRHRRFKRSLERNFERIADYIPVNTIAKMSSERRLLIGACFTHEYSVSAAAMFNPSLVLAPDQSNLPEGLKRVIISFRATGEGHISSIEFRSGTIDADCNITFDPISHYLESPDILPDHHFEKKLFRLKLEEIGLVGEMTDLVMDELNDDFTLADLVHVSEVLRNRNDISHSLFDEGLRTIHWLAESNYTVRFPSEHSISERVLFPVSENERQGIEDARFVRFTDDDGTVSYVATYTAYNGMRILPQIIETRDFITFKVSSLNGPAVANKGMALFPRKIDGLYVMLGRQDGENNYIMFSENLHFWHEKILLTKPEYPWEFIQIGNNGSPIETAEGWLVITHGVGPMRKYCLGSLLLDLHNPEKVIGRSKRPILCPNTEEREGYVPNVVYSCGAIEHNGQILLPYAMSDSISGFATLSLDKMLESLKS